MRIEVSSSVESVALKVLADEGESIVTIPFNVVGKLEAMLSKAKSHSGYQGSLECVEGKWRAGESFNLNA